jgi:hypothetical protein
VVARRGEPVPASDLPPPSVQSRALRENFLKRELPEKDDERNRAEPEAVEEAPRPAPKGVRRNMLRKLMIALGLVGIVLPLGSGCSTNEPVIWSAPHNKRRVMTVLNGFHRLHMDFDRIIFDMEEYPVETDY